MNVAQKAWDSYWADNQTANSFEFDYSNKDGPYGKINQYWQKVFSTFQAHSMVVDLAAGNGALSNLYLQCCDEAKIYKWVNIDSAITKKLVKSDKVEYQVGNLESLSFENNSVDNFVSMYGLEYARFEKSLAEIARCLKKKGRFHFILHHQDSVITHQSQITIDVYDQLSQKGLFTSLTNFTSIDALKKHLLTILQSTLQSCPEQAKNDVKIVGQQIYKILQQTIHLSQLIENLLSYNEQLNMHYIRLQQQIAAAIQVSELQQEIDKLGFRNVILEELKFENMIIAWQCSYEG